MLQVRKPAFAAVSTIDQPFCSGAQYQAAHASSQHNMPGNSGFKGRTNPHPPSRSESWPDEGAVKTKLRSVLTRTGLLPEFPIRDESERRNSQRAQDQTARESATFKKFRSRMLSIMTTSAKLGESNGAVRWMGRTHTQRHSNKAHLNRYKMRLRLI